MKCGFQLSILAVGLCVGNLAYEAFGSRNWGGAADHCWYNASALFAAWVVLRFSYIRPVSQGE